MKRTIQLCIFIILLSCYSCAKDSAISASVSLDGVDFVPMESERLPSLSRPRSGHVLVEAGGAVMVAGGHTTGFLPTNSVEILHNGHWKEMHSLYTHDTPFSFLLPDGDLLIGGGYSDNFGVGRTYSVERFDADRKLFCPEQVMDSPRAHSSAAVLGDGALFISGNWFGEDAVERASPGDAFATVQQVSQERSCPYILPVAPDTLWIFGGNCDSRMGPLDNVVDVLGGEPFESPFLEQWHPYGAYERNIQASVYNVAPWTFLIPAIDDSGTVAPVLVNGNGFMLLPMAAPLPMESPWEPVHWAGTFWVDASTRLAWLAGAGIGGQKRAYIAELDYGSALDGAAAGVKVHCSDPIEDLPAGFWELRVSDGSFVYAGGLGKSNYEPSGAAWIFYPEGRQGHAPVLWLVILPLLLLAAAAFLLLHSRKVLISNSQETIKELAEPLQDKVIGAAYRRELRLREKLERLMEEDAVYLRPGLKIADVAKELGTNSTYVSACLSGEMDTSFRKFITDHRISHSQHLMREHPEMRLQQVAAESGFSNEKTFMRTFKQYTGLTPSEWKKTQ